jgi:hypothetical protein
MWMGHGPGGHDAKGQREPAAQVDHLPGGPWLSGQAIWAKATFQ